LIYLPGKKPAKINHRPFLLFQAVGMQRKFSLQLIVIIATLSLFLGGCSALQPVRSAPLANSAPFFIAPTSAPQQIQATVQPTRSTDSQPANCTNVLSFGQDLSLPDGTYVNPGSSLDKQWQVRNSGTCNWNDTYTIQKIDGDLLGAASPQALVPARSGTQTTIRIVFTAPTEPGQYTSSWKAFTPDGEPFGDPFTILINVTNQ
jgi:hypothetical protein